MFIRKKKNKSGSVSVQLISKSSGKDKLVKRIGSSSDEQQIFTSIDKQSKRLRQL
jgi:hypothetical protein